MPTRLMPCQPMASGWQRCTISATIARSVSFVPYAPSNHSSLSLPPTPGRVAAAWREVKLPGGGVWWRWPRVCTEPSPSLRQRVCEAECHRVDIPLNSPREKGAETICVLEK